MKTFEIHTIERCYQEQHLEFFSEFFRSYPAPTARFKVKKEHDFNTFEVV